VGAPCGGEVPVGAPCGGKTPVGAPCGAGCTGAWVSECNRMLDLLGLSPAGVGDPVPGRAALGCPSAKRGVPSDSSDPSESWARPAMAVGLRPREGAQEGAREGRKEAVRVSEREGIPEGGREEEVPPKETLRCGMGGSGQAAASAIVWI